MHIYLNVLAYLCTESTEESVPEVAQRERKIFVKEISQKFAHPEIKSRHDVRLQVLIEILHLESMLEFF